MVGGSVVEAALTILLDGLQFSSYLFIVSAGLTIIFGVMKILNVAHGSFYAWGAYTAAFFIGKFSDMGLPDALGFLIIVAAAIVVGVILGFIIEQGILKYMYERDEVLIVLATFGLFLVLEDIILIAFGTDPYFAYQPMALLDAVEMGGIIRDVYGLTLIGVAAMVAVAVGCVCRSIVPIMDPRCGQLQPTRRCSQCWVGLWPCKTSQTEGVPRPA